MKDPEKSAWMHLINLEKKVRIGNYPMHLFQELEGAYAKGKYQTVIDAGIGARTNMNDAEIRRIEKQFEEMVIDGSQDEESWEEWENSHQRLLKMLKHRTLQYTKHK